MPIFFDRNQVNWRHPVNLGNRSFVCGYCSDKVSSDRGYFLGLHGDASGQQMGGLYICPNCNGPTFFAPDKSQHPGPAIGSPVQHLPADLSSLHSEARAAASTRAYTAAVLVCRKMLMNIAVSLGASSNLRFVEYVEYLGAQGYIPPNGKHWVDHIRKRGNEATHEIALMTESDARELLLFTEALLRFIYEFPAIVPPPAP